MTNPYTSHKSVSVYFDDRNNTDWQEEIYVEALNLAHDKSLCRVLDFGCGSGYKLMRYFGVNSRFTMVGQDIDPTLTWLRENFPKYAWQDAFSTPSFEVDLVICGDVLQYFFEPELVLSYFKVSFPQAYYVISAPLKKDKVRSPNVNEWTSHEFKALLRAHFKLLQYKTYRNKDHKGQYAICRS